MSIDTVKGEQIMKKCWSIRIDLGILLSGKAKIVFEFLDSRSELFDEFLDEKYPDLAAEIDDLLQQYEDEGDRDVNKEYHFFIDRLITEFSKTSFYDESHRSRYVEMLGRVGGSLSDPYRKSAAYLMALDPVIYKHAEDIFNFEKGYILPENISQAWQTGTSYKTTRLMFNLWNGYCTDGDTYTDKEGHEYPLPSSCYAVDRIFSCKAYAPYYWQAVMIRFEITD